MGRLNQSQHLTAWFQVGSVADSADDGGVQAGESTGGFRDVEWVIQRGIHAVRPVMTPQVMPEILDRIPFRRARRQTHERTVRRAQVGIRIALATLDHFKRFDCRTNAVRDTQMGIADRHGMNAY